MGGPVATAIEREHQADGLAVLDPERLLDYADRWRMLARCWARMAGKRSDPFAVRLRKTAQTALYAACEAEELLKVRGLERRATCHSASTRTVDVVSKIAPA